MECNSSACKNGCMFPQDCPESTEVTAPRLKFVDSVFNNQEVVCTGCNIYPCCCHSKMAESELARNGKRQIGGSRD